MKYVWLRNSLVLTASVLYGSYLKGSFTAMPAEQLQEPPAAPKVVEFRPKVVQLQAELMNSQARSGGIRINLKGTHLMPEARGEVNAKSSAGSTFLQAKFENLPSPTKLGEQYMTYVLWSMTVKDPPLKIGELEVKDSRGSIEGKTILQALGLFVTAEPYIEVSQPSNLVVLEQTVPNDLPQANTGIMAKADLLQDAYTPVGYTYEPLVAGIGQPLILRQALNARRIAQIARAEQFAPREYKEAESLYQFVLATVIAQGKPRKNDFINAVTVIREYEESRAASVEKQNRKLP